MNALDRRQPARMTLVPKRREEMTAEQRAALLRVLADEFMIAYRASIDSADAAICADLDKVLARLRPVPLAERELDGKGSE